MSGGWQLFWIVLGFIILIHMGCFGWAILAFIAVGCMCSGGSSGSSSSHSNNRNNDDDDDYDNNSGSHTPYEPEPDTTYDENEQPHTKWVE